MYLAAAEGAVFGGIGAGGLALCFAVFLVLGVKGKGRVKLKDNPAAVVAFIASTSFSAAGAIWSNPEKIVSQGLTGLGVESGSGPLGDVRIGAVALLLGILLACLPLTPFRGAVIGLIAGFVWPATGDGTLFAIPSELAAAALMMVGG